jgi:hypothetical protein
VSLFDFISSDFTCARLSVAEANRQIGGGGNMRFGPAGTGEVQLPTYLSLFFHLLHLTDYLLLPLTGEALLNGISSTERQGKAWI